MGKRGLSGAACFVAVGIAAACGTDKSATDSTPASGDGGGVGAQGGRATTSLDGGAPRRDGGAGSLGMGGGGGRTAESGGADASLPVNGSGGRQRDRTGGDSAVGGSSRDAGTGGGSSGTDSGPSIPKPPPPGTFTMHPAQGEVTLTTDAEMLAFCNQYDGVSGSLTISSPTITNLDALKCLVEVTGILEIDAYALTSAVLPKLRAVASLDLGSANGLAIVGLPVFEFARGDVRIYGSDALLGLALPSLAYVGQNFAITANTKLTDLSAPSLAYAGGDVSSSNSMLVHADFAGLVEVGHDFTITAPSLSQISLHELRKVGHNFTIPPGASYGDVDLTHLESVGAVFELDGKGNGTTDDLIILDLPNLVSAQNVTFWQHPQLKEIRAPRLTDATSVSASFDPVLQRIDFSSLVGGTVMCNADPALTTADFSSLATVKSFDFRTDGPGDISLPKLTTASDIQTSGLRSFVAPALTTLSSGTFNGATGGFRVSVPLVTQLGSLTLGTGLNDLTIPLLQSVDYLSVADVGLSELELGRLNHAKSIGLGRSPTLTSFRVPLVSDLDELYLGGPELQSASFAGLTTVNKLTLGDSPMLQTASFPSLTQVVDIFSVEGAGIVDVSIAQVSFLGDLYVVGNPNLKTLLLPAADILSLRVADNPTLTTLDLRGMTSPFFFSFSNNDKLTSFSGFGGLTAVQGNFFIVDHAALVDLQGLHGIHSVSGTFQITGNAALPKSEIDSLVAAIGRQNITGSFTVQ